MTSIRSFAAAILLAAAASIAQAAPITFVHTGVGSGMLDGIAFAGADFTITAVGDTDDRTSFGGGFSITHLSASIDLDGVGTFAFITGTRTFVNNSNGTPGFSRASGADLYNGPIAEAPFLAWDMLTSIGPILGTTSLLQWTLEDVLTTGGVLVFDSAQTRGTFQAIVGQAVPEPATLLLAGVALLAFAATARRRAR